jgi:hypothetical protein
MKKILILLSFVFSCFFCYSVDFLVVDAAHYNSKYKESLKILQESFDKSSPDPALIWRIGRETYYIANSIKRKKEKIKKFDEGLSFLKVYYDLKNGEIRDRASIIYWYAAIESEKSRLKGINESLDMIPILFKDLDNAIALDPAYGDPYYLKAMVDDIVPAMLGSDKFRMSQNISSAIACDPSNYWYLIDGGKAYINRNWSADKKTKLAKEKGVDDGSPQFIDDRVYGKSLIQKAAELYDSSQIKTKLMTEKIKEAKKILYKLKNK